MRTGISGNFWSFVKRVRNPFEFQGKCGLSLETLQLKRASSSVQVRISSFVWSCGRKLRVQLSFLLTWGTFRVSSGKSDLHWRSEVHLGIPHTLLQKEIGPHLDLRREPQGSYPFLSSITGSLQSWNRRVRPHLVLRNGTPLASHIVHGMTGHLSSCIWNLWLFPDYASGVSVPLRVVTSFSGLHSKRCPGN